MEREQGLEEVRAVVVEAVVQEQEGGRGVLRREEDLRVRYRVWRGCREMEPKDLEGPWGLQVQGDFPEVSNHPD